MTRDSISIITPTGDRPQALRYLTDYIARQTFAGAVQWVVVDDGKNPYRPEARSPANCSDWELTYRRRDEPGVPGGSLNRNLIIGLRLARHDKIVIMEDDDWYAPMYLETYAELLDHHPLVGESRARYYHVAARKFYEPGNTRWASLAQTGFRRELVPQVDDSCRQGTPFIDLKIWERAIPGKHLIHNHGLCVSIKAMPGRRGLGQGGHTAGRLYKHDHNLRQLHKWIGADADRYTEFRAPGDVSTVSRSWFDWLAEQPAEPPWLVLGKGPTFTRHGEFDLSKFRTLGLNHVCDARPVDIAHIIDLECLEDLGERLLRAKFLVCPWHPHRGHSPQKQTLADHCRRLPALARLSEEGRLLHYHLLWAEKFASRPADEPIVGVANYSVHPAVNLVIGSGLRGVFTLGIDGGKTRSKEFAGQPAGVAQRVGYDRQFKELSRIARVNRAAIWPLTGKPLDGSHAEAVARLHPHHPALRKEAI